MRSDTRRNISRLMRAVSEEIEEGPEKLTMQSAAARAGIGTATAYRYFSSLDELFAAYIDRILDDLEEFASQCPLTGRQLFDAVLGRWTDLVLDHGKVMVQLRSKLGFLHRLDSGDPAIKRTCSIWEAPLEGLLAHLGLPPGMLRQAFFLSNILIDPREILDLHAANGLDPTDLVRHLGDAVSGALLGWTHHKAN